MNVKTNVWRWLIILLASCFLLLAAAEAFGKQWSSGDPDGNAAPYIGKDTEAGCEVLTYRGLTVWRLSKAFDIHEWLIVFVNQLDHSAIIREGEWLLIPDRDCGGVDWKYLDPPKDHGRVVQGAQRVFLYTHTVLTYSMV